MLSAYQIMNVQSLIHTNKTIHLAREDAESLIRRATGNRVKIIDRDKGRFIDLPVGLKPLDAKPIHMTGSAKNC